MSIRLTQKPLWRVCCGSVCDWCLFLHCNGNDAQSFGDEQKWNDWWQLLSYSDECWSWCFSYFLSPDIITTNITAILAPLATHQHKSNVLTRFLGPCSMHSRFASCCLFAGVEILRSSVAVEPHPILAHRISTYTQHQYKLCAHAVILPLEISDSFLSEIVNVVCLRLL